MKLKNYYSRTHAFFKKLISSIAFIPSILSGSAFLLGVLLVSAGDMGLKDFFDDISIVRIKSVETLRAILTSFLTGVISILIFGFSMVMVVLNQAASQYSPRVLNWLISKRSNHYVLGAYLGTIVFTVILLLRLPGDVDFTTAYHFAILLDSGFIFLCLVLFVSLISNVSTDIQISSVVENIRDSTLKRLKEEETNISMDGLREQEDDKWVDYNTRSGGYLQSIGQDGLVRIAQKNDLMIRIHLNTGYYYLKGDRLYSINKVNINREREEEIASHFVFYEGERIQDNSYYGFKQLSEIAVKALSPGINDPRTANNCIDYLTELFAVWIEKKDARLICDNEGNPRVLIYSHSFGYLLNICLTPILIYGKNDVNILQSLLVMLRKLGERDREKKYREELNQFLGGLQVEVEKQRSNEYFYNYLDTYRDKLRIVGEDYFYALDKK